MARLPIPGSDHGSWGDILNDFLLVEHNADGTLQESGTLSTKQPKDDDLTAIAALSPTNDDVLQRKNGAWTNRTTAQVKTDLGLVKGDVGLGNADNTSDANKPVSTATQAALDGKASTTQTVEDRTATSYTLVLADARKLLRFDSASAQTLTVPPSSSVAFPVGTIIDIAQVNTGILTLAPGAGVTINSPSGLIFPRQWAMGRLIKTDADRWLLETDNSLNSVGEDLGYAERTTDDTTTNTNSGATSSNKISGIAVTVTGNGRPVQIEFRCATTHSLADASVGAHLLENDTLIQFAATVNRSATRPGVLTLSQRRVIPAGETRTYEVGKFVMGSGTGTYVANPSYPMWIQATQR